MDLFDVGGMVVTMRSSSFATQKLARRTITAVVGIAFAMACPQPGYADSYPLAPQTKLRVTVVQWIPAKGEYQKWEPVGGEYVVSAAGTISLPLIGSMDVTSIDSSDLATEIAERLKAKTGLINTPDATVEILEYPQIYMVGSVTTPGAYQFKPGMTVLQALALSGGRYRSNTEGGSKGEIGMLGELQEARNDILRTLGRIARLQAEAADAKEIHFPSELTAIQDDKTAAEIMAQEQIIFAARTKGLERQLDNLSELRGLFSAEIDILGTKTETLDKGIKLVEDELAGVKSLVDRGIATVSRRSELERAVAGLQSNRLDEVTAAMRARQNLSEATRNSLSLRDKHQTDIAADMQDAQANLDRLKIKEDVLKKVLIVNGSSMTNDRQNEDTAEPSLSFAIVRQTQGKIDEVAGSESTLLLPGDVVKVTINQRSRPRVGVVSSAAPSQ
ncbi:polysaccharide biosynthesis/export family protein [Microvirga terricola]|uniref:Exopolysaccharide biosynthesis protein n=1 Tax=Microvirga terricola TaxID=2719797 RepID=A0ABX0V7X6_9HYPH|nr:polysaccharide biosynthesis/export family protein [Microvirga terricola]NIX75678.1 exopolysaccharide biosynthesis protein [Microvirga terricola]